MELNWSVDEFIGYFVFVNSLLVFGMDLSSVLYVY